MLGASDRDLFSNKKVAISENALAQDLKEGDKNLLGANDRDSYSNKKVEKSQMIMTQENQPNCSSYRVPSDEG